MSYHSLMLHSLISGRAASQGMFFAIFVLNRVSILSFFCLNQGIDFINFCLKKGIFLDDKQAARLFYELNYRNFFTRSYGLNFVLKQGRKMQFLS